MSRWLGEWGLGEAVWTALHVLPWLAVVVWSILMAFGVDLGISFGGYEQGACNAPPC